LIAGVQMLTIAIATTFWRGRQEWAPRPKHQQHGSGAGL